jgi:hypothetical protein
MRTRRSFLGVKQSERKTEDSPPYIAEVKTGGAIPLLPAYLNGKMLLKSKVFLVLNTTVTWRHGIAVVRDG